MILAMDIGNTNLKLGVYKNDIMIAGYKMAASLNRTADEYALSITDSLKKSGIVVNDIKGIIISSVKPNLNYTIEQMCDYYFNMKPLIVDYRLKSNIKYKVDYDAEIGGDRICDMAAAQKKYGAPFIVVDFGTATVFNVVNSKGEFIGGAIAPGISSSLSSLVNNTSKLPNIEITTPSKVIASDTVSNMQSGLVYGFVGLVEYLTAKMKEESAEKNIKVIATGGFAQIISKHTKCFDFVEKTLTLDGLNVLYKLNRGKKL